MKALVNLYKIMLPSWRRISLKDKFGVAAIVMASLLSSWLSISNTSTTLMILSRGTRMLLKIACMLLRTRFWVKCTQKVSLATWLNQICLKSSNVCWQKAKSMSQTKSILTPGLDSNFKSLPAQLFQAKSILNKSSKDLIKFPKIPKQPLNQTNPSSN